MLYCLLKIRLTANGINMKSDMMDDTVFKMIEIGGEYGVQKEMKKVL